MSSLSIILPVYNEARNIQNVVSNILINISCDINDSQIVMVDDGSTDGTSAILHKLESLHSNVQVIIKERHQGYGGAVKTGIKHCDKKYIFIMDADGQFRMENFREFWINRNSYDFILGYRKKREDNLYRVFLGKLGNLCANLLLKKRIIDINCGFKLFKKDELQKLYLTSNSGTIYFEILYNLLRRKQYHFSQLPVKHYKREKGRQTGGRFSVILKIASEAAKILSLKDKR